MEVTLQHRRGEMLGAPEVLQLNANLIQAMGAKKVSPYAYKVSTGSDDKFIIKH